MKIEQAAFVHCVGFQSQLPPPELPEIAFVGRSNVGKSSLINGLIQRKALARTSGQPGKTQTINFYSVNGSFYLVDLPGYGFAKVPQGIRNRWQGLMEDYLGRRESLRGAVLVVDSRHEPSPLDLQMQRWLKFHGKPLLIVATKMDKLRQREKGPFLRRLENGFGAPVYFYSSEKNVGREAVWPQLLDMLK